MESFAVLLVASVLFLGFLFAGTYLLDLQYNGPAVKRPSSVTIDLASFPQFFIGFTKEDKARTINYDDFALGTESSMKIKEVLEQDISEGLFSSKGLSLDVAMDAATISDAISAALSFEVADTNNYGNLVVTWNGKDYYNDRPAAGKVSVKLPKESLKNENMLVIKSTGPGARFWASSFYSLKNIKFETVTVSKRTIFFDVFPEEVTSWSSGVLNFRRADYSSQNGILKAYVNGKLVYNSFPLESDAIQIGPDTIRSGTNLIKFESEGGVFSLKNVFLNVFLWKNRTSGITKSFILDPDYLTLLNSSGYSGVVRIKLGEVLKAAPLEVRFRNNKTGTKSVFITELKDNMNASFGADQVGEGNNTLTFATDGSMRVDYVDVFIQGR
ncbi:MAG: hypothetical protein HY515_01820 [Candidatus Aenigmarchaeota archaeon]|nr:hypothetical protein [Candidatus Aenigmarchaeota archaeon]